MSDVPLALALAAGMLAAVNPCGFAMLPAYLTLLVVGDDSPSRGVAIGRALAATAAMTAGFAAVFGVFGLVVAPAASQIQQHLPWVTIVLGLLLAAAGGWLLAGRELPALIPKLRRGPAVTRSASSMALFGGAYAIASLGCTIGPFLAIVVSAFRTDSTAAGVALFGAYSAGMGLIVGVAALAVALARRETIGRIRRLGAIAARAGGGLLLLAGAYVAYYGWYEIRVFRGTTTTDPVIDAAGKLQTRIADTLGNLGVPTIAVLFVVLLLIAAITIRRARRLRRLTEERADSADTGGSAG
ncbi:cytochrome c biogenesis CcdA family protein [Kribbella sp. NPDC050124]|uniref:cytochrome c biogenesis CcdA family protein n=1 Tax=Kribbella sp. NPDC050124 TaxID=3364114 RepID=UPI00379895BA